MSACIFAFQSGCEFSSIATAAWVQAAGSIVAIAALVKVTAWQLQAGRRSMERARLAIWREEVSALYGIATLGAELLGCAVTAMRKSGAERYLGEDFRPIEFGRIVDALRSVPLHTLRTHDMVVHVTELRDSVELGTNFLIRLTNTPPDEITEVAPEIRTVG